MDMLPADVCKKSLTVLPSALMALLTIANVAFVQTALPNDVQSKFGIISIRITMGLKDEQPTDWSGRMSIDRGAILRLHGWQFDRNDRIKGASWKCRTRWAPVHPFPLWRADGTRPPVKQRPRPVGIIATVDAPPDAQLAIETPKGKVNMRISDVKLGAPVASLNGQISIERIPTSSTPLPTTKAFRDYPAMLIDGEGTLWIAYVQHIADAGDRVVVARGDVKRMSEVFITPTTDIYKVALGLDKSERVWVTWSEQSNGNWDIYGAVVSASGTKVIRLTSALEPDMEHAMVRDARGNLWVVWQGFRGGQSDILARYFDGTKWSREMRISHSDANDWQPAIAADKRGRVYIAWDSYANGNYDIFMRWIDVDKMTPSPIIQVTTSLRFQAHVTLTCDDNDRLWLAWDESAPNWGKDYGFRIKAPGTWLYAWRALRVACWQNGKLHQPTANLNQAMPPELPVAPAYNDYPHITIDGNGRLWVFFRHRTAKNPRVDGWTAAGMWSIYG
ncbi:MAG TPA: hypothetical protein EYP10_05580, partial [Armatimonadetes bacterium]|nr:hypothetical protein [Armatimonadota bacterium]